MTKLTEVGVYDMLHGGSGYLLRRVQVQPIGRLCEKDGVRQLLLQLLFCCFRRIKASGTLVRKATIYAKMFQGLLVSI